jgi:hypothetical protein
MFALAWHLIELGACIAIILGGITLVLNIIVALLTGRGP